MNATTNNIKRRVKQYDSLADLYADKEKQALLLRNSHHHNVRNSNANVRVMKHEDVLVKYNKRRRTGKTDRERISGEAKQRFSNRTQRSANPPVYDSCNGKKTRAIRKAGV